MIIVNAWFNYLIQSCTVHNFLYFLDMCCKLVIFSPLFFRQRKTNQLTEKIQRDRPLTFPIYLICASFIYVNNNQEWDADYTNISRNLKVN